MTDGLGSAMSDRDRSAIDAVALPAWGLLPDSAGRKALMATSGQFYCPLVNRSNWALDSDRAYFYLRHKRMFDVFQYCSTFCGSPRFRVGSC